MARQTSEYKARISLVRVRGPEAKLEHAHRFTCLHYSGQSFAYGKSVNANPIGKLY
jgi:hypothetical protein